MQTLNHVVEANLEVHAGADLSFECQWWADEDETQPVALASGQCLIKAPDTTHVIDATINANSALFVVDRAVVDTWEAFENAPWELALESATGDRRKVLRGGTARYIRDAQ